MKRLTEAGLVVVFLAAIVAANLITSRYGPEASIYNAFFLIGLDLTTRDALHDFWERHRIPKMAALIGAGALIAFLLDADAGRVATASAVAFAAAISADWATYSLLRRREWLERANVSNVVGAAVDSIVFPTLAFGSFKWAITFGQFTAKVAGGFIWSVLLGRLRARRLAVA